MRQGGVRNDRWSSTKGNSPSYPKGNGTWKVTATFGTGVSWSTSKAMTEAAVLMFYR
ncbi:MAG: hypothetical protein ACOYOB_00845 [Myxococcota bacterium]